MTPEECAAAVRRGAGLFRLEDRGLLEVTGSDRERWLNGQVSNEVAGLAPEGPRSGCPALLLTAQGRIVADLQVLARPGAFWLECDAAALPAVQARLAKVIIADDVTLADRSAAVARLGLEGPQAAQILARALGHPLALAPGSTAEVGLAGAEALVAAFGWSGEPAFQLFVPPERTVAVAETLQRAGQGAGLVAGDALALEILRVEAGVPRFGRELDEDVLPAETPLLGPAVSFTKGCYTGQEIVARMHSRGQVKYRLVGLRCQADAPPAPGAALHAGGRSVGEVTSAARSPAAGAIALAFVKRPHDAPGTELQVEGRRARVAYLPLVDPTGPGP